MKKRITLLTMTFLLLQASFGQDDKNSDPKFGLGVSLFNLTDFVYEDVPTNFVHLTINISNKFRLEPIIGFGISPGYEQYFIGIGTFGRKSISKFDLLYGLRLGLSSDDTKVIAPAIGGEYYFIKNFSIGSEIQLRGLIYNGNWAVITNSSVIVRFYL